MLEVCAKGTVPPCLGTLSSQVSLGMGAPYNSMSIVDDSIAWINLSDCVLIKYVLKCMYEVRIHTRHHLGRLL